MERRKPILVQVASDPQVSRNSSKKLFRNRSHSNQKFCALVPVRYGKISLIKTPIKGSDYGNIEMKTIIKFFKYFLACLFAVGMFAVIAININLARNSVAKSTLSIAKIEKAMATESAGYGELPTVVVILWDGRYWTTTDMGLPGNSH
jgi:hypothetical protein